MAALLVRWGRASMRPRPEGRGELPSPQLRATGGNRFNAATTRRSWRTLGAKEQCLREGGLQCGHDPKVVENRRPARASRKRYGRFNAATTRRSWRTAVWPPGRCSLLSLQCGHDPKVVENPSIRQHVDCSRPGFNAATTRRSWRTPRTAWRYRTKRGSFNAATTRRSWRTPSTLGDCTWLQMLQCGHDPKVVENRASGVTSCPTPIRFNAATTRRSWRTGNAAQQGGALYRFNAATTRRSWRTVVESNQWSLSGRASMRPRPEGRGELTNDGYVHVGSVLQCGHDPKVVENGRGLRPVHGSQRASMRPRPEGRGERLPARRPAPGGRRCFNAATTRRSWRTRRRPALTWRGRWLQCGHDPKVVENPDRRDARAAVGRASMRPRPEGRGERRRGVAWGHPVTGASMRPRPEGRGERRRGVAWGHPVTGASMRPRPEGRGERGRSRRRQSSRTELQCGHDPKVVEN